MSTATATLPNSPEIAFEATPGGPGYVAYIANGDAETDPIGSGMTRSDAALDLARSLWATADDRICIAIAAVLREDGHPQAAALVEGMW